MWLVQVFGEKCSGDWEISVVRDDNELGRKSWGWFGAEKMLVSHNGGPCNWPVLPYVWDAQIKLAHDLCDKLNSGEVTVPDDMESSPKFESRPK